MNEEIIKQETKKIALWQATERLIGNKDFEDVIINGFLNEGVQKCLSEYATADDGKREKLVETLMSRSELKSFLEGVMADGKIALERIQEVEEYEAKQENGGDE